MKEMRLADNQVTIVDDIDYQIYKDIKMCFEKTSTGRGYVSWSKSIKGKTVHFRLHRILMNAGKGEVVDHINGNTLDNRRENLRICNIADNAHNCKVCKKNTSGFRGVYWNKKGHRWYARTVLYGKPIFIGSFKDKIEAALAYDNFIKEKHGDFARTNF